MLQAGRSQFRDPMRSLIFSNLSNPSSPALGPGVYSTSNRNEDQKRRMFLGSRGRPMRKADKLIAICEPIV
jgi:hypothetical protein